MERGKPSRSPVAESDLVGLGDGARGCARPRIVPTSFPPEPSESAPPSASRPAASLRRPTLLAFFVPVASLAAGSPG